MKLQNLRHARHVKWPIYIFFGIVIVSFIFFYGWNQADRNSGDSFNQNYAKLRSDSIHPLRRWTYLDKTALLDAKLQAIEEKRRAMPPLPQQLQQMIDQQDLFKNLVTTEDQARIAADDVLLKRTAGKLKMRISDDEFANMLRRTPGVNDDILEREAQQMGFGDKYSFFEFLRRSEEQMRIKSIEGLVAHASLFELWQEYSLANEKLVLRMAAYPIADFEDRVAVTAADLAKYLAEHKEAFRVPPMRRYAHVTVKRGDLLAKIKPTADQLKAYYEQNNSQYLEKASTRVDEIFSPLGEGALTSAPQALLDVRVKAAAEAGWSTLTQTLTAQTTGTEFLDRGDRWIEDAATDVTPRFLALIKSMDKGTTGVKSRDNNTTVIFDDKGYHLVRVLERRKEGVPALEKIKDRVETDYKEKEAEKQFQAEAERFKSELKKLTADNTTTASVHALAQRLKLNDRITTRVQTDAAEIPGAGTFERGNSAYLAGLALGELSDVVPTPDSIGVFQVVEQKDGYDPPLAEVKDKVETAYRKTRAVELAQQAAKQGLSLASSGAQFDQALADAPRKPFDTGEFTRPETVTGLDAPLIDFRRQTLKIDAGATGMSPYGNDPKAPLGYAVWKVSKLISPSQEDFAKERQRFEQDYMQVAQETVVREWLADERARAQYQYLAEKR